MKKHNNILWVGLALIGSFLLASCGQKGAKNAAAEVQTLHVGIQNSPSNALLLIADAKRLFDTAQVRVQIKEFSAGKLALQALLATTDLDAAVSAETPVVLSSLAGNRVKILSQVVDAKNECRVVVRRDGDLNTVEQYFSKHRVLATSQGGSPEWLTYNFLKKYNLGPKQVEIAAMAPENMPAAVASKAIDGCSIFDPYARLAEQELGKDGLTFLNEDMKSYYVISIREQQDQNRQAALTAFLQGLLRAEQFIRDNPGEAQQIVAQRTKIDAQIVQSTWSNYNFSLGFSPDFPALCQAQAAWAIETGKYPKETPVPNFEGFLERNLLETAQKASH